MRLKMSIVKSPIIYPGSKGAIMDEILPLISDFKEYREPFLGSASMFLSAKQRYPDTNVVKYWINDLNYELFNFWKTCRDDMLNLTKQIKEFRYSYPNNGKELFLFLRKNVNSVDFDNLKLSAAYYILNRTAFSGGTLVSGFSQDHYENFKNDNLENLKKIQSFLQNVKITNFDYQRVVESPSNLNSEDVLLINDPPYLSATDSGLYGKSGSKWNNLHKTFDHYRFARIMKESKYRYIITYDDSPFIRRLFSFANQKSWTFTHKMRKDKIGKELLISNFALKDILKTEQVDITKAWM